MVFSRSLIFALLAVGFLVALPFVTSAATTIVQQADGSISGTYISNCDNRCGNITFGSQVFVPAATSNLGSIEVFTSNFKTDSRNPDTNNCVLSLYNQDTGEFLAQSDNQFSGYSCANDLVFSFNSSQPLLQVGTHYRWDFVFVGQNRTELTFWGSPNDTVGGSFSRPPVVNAKFTALGSIPRPAAFFMHQFKSDGVSDIPGGGITSDSEVTFAVPFLPPPAEPLQLQVEVRPTGLPFTGNFDGGMATSSFVDAGTPARVTKVIADGLWHWRARFADNSGNFSNWVEFGTPSGTDFIVQSVPPPTDSSILAYQPDGSIVSHTNTHCSNICPDVIVASQTFKTVRTGPLQAIEIFTANFTTDSLNPYTNGCSLTLFNQDTNTPVASADYGFAGPACANDLIFPFRNSAPILQAGVRYRWDFHWTGNYTGLDFFGSPNNVVDGLFSPGPVVNAKFIATSFAREPVVIIPGMMGSKLNRVSDGEEVWPNAQEMANSDSDDYLDILKFSSDWNQVAGQEMSPSDVIRNATGTIAGLISFNRPFFKPLIDSFTSTGYTENSNLFVAPFDWRINITDSAASIDSVIQNAIAHSPTGKINIIAHSMGGLVLKKYLSDKSSASFIDKLILAGSPQLGSPLMFKVLQYGDDLGFTFGPFKLLNSQEAKSISQNMPGAYDLLPSRRYVETDGSYVLDRRNQNASALTFDGINQFMTSNPEDSRNSTLLSSADNFHALLDPSPVNAPNIYNIVGCQKPTIKSFIIQDNNSFKIIRGNGDGTVPVNSAFNLANGYNNYFSLNSENGADHTGLIRDGHLITLINAIINNATSTLSLAPLGISTSTLDCVEGRWTPAPNETTIEISTHSPIALNAYDSQNRHTGPNANGDVDLQIPGSSYETIGENSFILLPASDTYRILGNALSSGAFTLKLKGYDDSVNLLNTTTYVQVPLASASTTANMIVSSSASAPEISLDLDGNGTIDQVVQPTAQLNASSSSDFDPPLLAVSSVPTDVILGATTTITFSFSDSGSGVATSSASLNGVAFVSGQVISFDTPGTSTLRFFAEDNAGNPAVIEYNVRVHPVLSVELIPLADTYLKKGTPNKNQGSESVLRARGKGFSAMLISTDDPIQTIVASTTVAPISSTSTLTRTPNDREVNRTLILFDQAQLQDVIANGTLISAKLEFVTANNISGLGATEKTMDIHRMTKEWTELSATWVCPNDTNASNSLPDCSSAWNMDNPSLWPFVSAPTASALATTTVDFDVTNDVKSFISGTANYGWILKKTNEQTAGLVEFGSRGTTSEPKLVIHYAEG